eukprot:358478-Chlamydomonas_euryale.AAC.18
MGPVQRSCTDSRQTGSSWTWMGGMCVYRGSTLPDDCGVSIGFLGVLVNNHLLQALHCSRPVDSLLYADIIFLMATSIEALTHMLTHLNAICEDLGLEITFMKIEVQNLGCTTAGQTLSSQLSIPPFTHLLCTLPRGPPLRQQTKLSTLADFRPLSRKILPS